MFATRFGVSLENVVATSEMPASHHGTERPDAKNSVVFLLARLPKANAGRKQIRTQAAAMIQSTVCRVMGTGCQHTLPAEKTLQDFSGDRLREKRLPREHKFREQDVCPNLYCNLRCSFFVFCGYRACIVRRSARHKLDWRFFALPTTF